MKQSSGLRRGAWGKQLLHGLRVPSFPISDGRANPLLTSVIVCVNKLEWLISIFARTTKCFPAGKELVLLEPNFSWQQSNLRWWLFYLFFFFFLILFFTSFWLKMISFIILFLRVCFLSNSSKTWTAWVKHLSLDNCKSVACDYRVHWC